MAESKWEVILNTLRQLKNTFRNLSTTYVNFLLLKLLIIKFIWRVYISQHFYTLFSWYRTFYFRILLPGKRQQSTPTRFHEPHRSVWSDLVYWSSYSWYRRNLSSRVFLPKWYQLSKTMQQWKVLQWNWYEITLHFLKF